MKWKSVAAAACVAPVLVLGVAQVRSAALVRAEEERARLAVLEARVNVRLDEMMRRGSRSIPGVSALAQAEEARQDPPPAHPDQAIPALPPTEPSQDAAPVLPDQPPMDAAPSEPSPDAPPIRPEEAAGLPAPTVEERTAPLPQATVLEPVAPPPRTYPPRRAYQPVAPPTDLSGLPPRLPSSNLEDRLEPLPEATVAEPVTPSRRANPGDLLAEPRSRPSPSGRMTRGGDVSLPILDGTPETGPQLDARRPPLGEEQGAAAPTADEGRIARETRDLAQRLAQQWDAESADGVPRPASAELENLRNRLRVLVTTQFIERQRAYAADVDALEARVARLREMIQKRESNRDRIIDQRIEQLKVEAQGMGW